MRQISSVGHVAAFVPRREDSRCSKDNSVGVHPDVVGSTIAASRKNLFCPRKNVRLGGSGVERAPRAGIPVGVRAHEWHSFSPLTESLSLLLMLASPPLVLEPPRLRPKVENEQPPTNLTCLNPKT